MSNTSAVFLTVALVALAFALSMDATIYENMKRDLYDMTMILWSAGLNILAIVSFWLALHFDESGPDEWEHR
jgi:hypothetical protein